MQPIHILRDDVRNDGRILQRCESIVRGVGLRVANGWIAEV